MGHTLVACFQERELAPLVSMLSRWDGSPSNKIPFGRDCDRVEADKILPYHMTILHWASSNDKIMLPKLKKLALPSLTVIADGVRVLPAGENSSLVYIKIEPTASFEQWCHGQGKALGVCFDTSFLHITVAVSKNAAEMKRLAKYFNCSMTFPFELHIQRLELYHIWNPVRLVDVWEEQLE